MFCFYLDLQERNVSSPNSFAVPKEANVIMLGIKYGSQ